MIRFWPNHLLSIGPRRLWGTQTRRSPRLAPSPAEPASQPEPPGSRSRSRSLSGSAAPRTSVLPGGGRRCLDVPPTGYTTTANSKSHPGALHLLNRPIRDGDFESFGGGLTLG